MLMSYDGYISNYTNNAIKIGDNSEDLIFTFGTNSVTLSSSTGVTSLDFGTLATTLTSTGTFLFKTGTGGSATDSSIVLTGSTGQPIQKFYGTDGDEWDMSINTSDQALFSNASGGYVFANGVILGVDGSSSAPTYSFSNSAGLGIYRNASNVLGFTTAGSDRAFLDASGRFSLGIAQTSGMLGVANSTNQANLVYLTNEDGTVKGVVDSTGNIEGHGFNFASDTSTTANAVKIVLAGVSELATGLEVTVDVANANSGAMTLTVNDLTSKAITKAASGAVTTAIASGDVLAGQIVKLVYDGTQFQVISRLAQ